MIIFRGSGAADWTTQALRCTLPTAPIYTFNPHVKKMDRLALRVHRAAGGS
jgi:hypothetical protein